jgi:hypothetical protein
MVRPAAMSPFAFVFAATATLSAGCFDTSSSTATLDFPTLLTVDPLRFRGTLSCGEPGLARYVVSIFNLNAPATGCESPPCATATSIPVRCEQQVSFGQPLLQPNNYYTAIIEGYNRDDIKQKAAGSRDMLDVSSSALIAPTWTTTCGELPPDQPDEDAGIPELDAEADAADAARYNPLRFPTRVLDKAEVFLHGCIPFSDVNRPDASDDGGSPPPDDASFDVEPPHDVSVETGADTAPDASTPDSGGPQPEDAAEGGGGD